MRACYALKPLNWRDTSSGDSLLHYLKIGKIAYSLSTGYGWVVDYFNGNKWVNIAVGSSEFEAKKIAIKHFYDNHVYPYFDDVSELAEWV